MNRRVMTEEEDRGICVLLLDAWGTPGIDPPPHNGVLLILKEGAGLAQTKSSTL